MKTPKSRDHRFILNFHIYVLIFILHFFFSFSKRESILITQTHALSLFLSPSRLFYISIPNSIPSSFCFYIFPPHSFSSLCHPSSSLYYFPRLSLPHSLPLRTLSISSRFPFALFTPWSFHLFLLFSISITLPLSLSIYLHLVPYFLSIQPPSHPVLLKLIILPLYSLFFFNIHTFLSLPYLSLFSIFFHLLMLLFCFPLTFVFSFSISLLLYIYITLSLSFHDAPSITSYFLYIPYFSTAFISTFFYLTYLFYLSLSIYYLLSPAVSKK